MFFEAAAVVVVVVTLTDAVCAVARVATPMARRLPVTSESMVFI